MGGENCVKRVRNVEKYFRVYSNIVISIFFILIFVRCVGEVIENFLNRVFGMIL